MIKIWMNTRGQGQPNREIELPFETFRFPVGEDHVKLDYRECDGWAKPVHIKWEIPTPAQGMMPDLCPQGIPVMRFLLVCDALRRAGHTLEYLYLPYVPYGRQDHLSAGGEPLSLKVFADLINLQGFGYVTVCDPHSDVTTALIDRVKVMTQESIWRPVLERRTKPFWLVAPDAGAGKKIDRLADGLTRCRGVIQCSKARDPQTGKITRFNWTVPSDFFCDDLVVLDDICDGGATFKVLAESLAGMGNLTLCVTHGFFTRGLDPLSGYHEIWTRKGQVR